MKYYFLLKVRLVQISMGLLRANLVSVIYWKLWMVL